MTAILGTPSSLVLPARDFDRSLEAWGRLLDRDPAWHDGDYATFTLDGFDLSLSRLPWVDHPLPFWEVQDVRRTHAALVAEGAVALVETPDGSLGELGVAPAAPGNQDPATGIVEMPGVLLAVLRAADGTIFGIQGQMVS